MFSILATLYFIEFGFESSRLAVALITIVGLSGIFWLRDSMAFAGMYKELLFTDYKELKALLKERGAVIGIGTHFNVEAQQSSKESPK